MNINGLRFECTRCGACCRRPGWVYFSPEEIRAASGHLGIGVKTFRRRWIRKLGDGIEAVEVPEGSTCPFLDEDNECIIQEVKPGQCVAYPFWIEILEERRGWEKEALFCEGIGRGEEIPPEKVLSFVLLE